MTRWVPKKFAALSERLTTSNGILIIGCIALGVLFTKGKVDYLIVMYSINVFLTFSLSTLGMLWDSIKNYTFKSLKSFKNFLLFFIGFILCITILGITITEKFTTGGWVTLVFTFIVVLICLLIKSHYKRIHKKT